MFALLWFPVAAQEGEHVISYVAIRLASLFLRARRSACDLLCRYPPRLTLSPRKKERM
jgi:hypothetical protein